MRHDGPILTYVKRIAFLVGSIFSLSKNNGEGAHTAEYYITRPLVCFPRSLEMAQPLLEELFIDLDLVPHLVRRWMGLEAVV